MTPKNTKLAAKIKRALNKTAKQIDSDIVGHRKQWTIGVKDALISLGKRHNKKESRCEHGYVTCASGCRADDGEWLYDVCWLNYEDNYRNRINEPNPLRNVALAAESEWSRNQTDIDDDFTKLIIAKADFRLFICWMSGSREDKIKVKREDLVNRLKTLVVQSNISTDNDQYLIACWDKISRRFNYAHFTKAEARRDVRHHSRTRIVRE